MNEHNDKSQCLVLKNKNKFTRFVSLGFLPMGGWWHHVAMTGRFVSGTRPLACVSTRLPITAGEIFFLSLSLFLLLFYF